MMKNWFENKHSCHPRESGDPAASVRERMSLSAHGRGPLDSRLRGNDRGLKYRMLGVALAAIMANVGFSAAHDPGFSMREAVMLTALCIVTTYIIYRAVSLVEAVARRRQKD
jgi:hypothetical protein